MSVNQNVPTCVAPGPTTGAGEPELREQQPVFVGGGLQLSRAACLLRSTSGGLGTTASAIRFRSRWTMWGEFFQLAHRPYRLLEGLGPVDDDQRHRLVLYGSVNSSMRRRGRPGNESVTASSEQHAAGVLGPAAQRHVGRDHRAGHCGKAHRGRVRSSAEISETVPDFFSVSLRLNRAFAVGRAVRVDAWSKSST